MESFLQMLIQTQTFTAVQKMYQKSCWVFAFRLVHCKSL